MADNPLGALRRCEICKYPSPQVFRLNRDGNEWTVSCPSCPLGHDSGLHTTQALAEAAWNDMNKADANKRINHALAKNHRRIDKVCERLDALESERADLYQEQKSLEKQP